MARIAPLDRDDLPGFEPVFKGMDRTLGYVPNSFLTMARDPAILDAVGALSDAAWYPATVTEAGRRLITFAFSHFAGVPYSAAHCGCGAEELGLAREKLLEIDRFDSAPVYSAAEKAMLRLCRSAAAIPPSVRDDEVAEVKRLWGEDRALFAVGLMAYMAFLNKWNEILGTGLEAVPAAWAAGFPVAPGRPAPVLPPVTGAAERGGTGPRFAPGLRADLPQHEAVFQAIEADHGYVPNSFLTQARLPGMLDATGLLAEALWYSETPSEEIRRLLSYAYSLFSGAMYSAAHTGASAADFGVPVEKLVAVRNWRESPLFDARERAVLALCEAAASAPAQVNDAHLAELARHFDQVTILRITGLIAWHGFLNKWNELCGTRLEDLPRAFAEKHLRAAGWQPGVHG